MKNQTTAFLLAFILLFALLSGLGFLTGDLDWTWGRILICLVVVSGAAIAWSLIKGKSLEQSLREIGFGVPRWRVIGISVLLSLLMLTFFPLYSSLTTVSLPLQNKWPWILIGIITGVGIAEETLFRGFAFHFLREKHPFWRAATLSMILFAVMHLLLMLWLPLPIAIAAIILAIIAAYPTAYLFETSNRTIWPSAVLHTTALSTNLFEIPTNRMISLSLLWIGVIMIGLFMVFLVGRLVLRQSE
jgi:membrane protease YdiL (CAAX protease family)